MRWLWWLALPLLTVGCARQPTEPLRVAIAMAENQRAGIRLAVDEINDGGGIAGRPLEIVGMDWLDPGIDEHAKVIQWADRLSADPSILAVIGHSDSNSTLAAAGLYNERGIPHLVTVATNPLITQAGPWTYRLCLDDEAQGRLLARFAITDWQKRRAAVFYVDDDYGRGLAELFSREYTRLGGQILTRTFHHNRLQDQDRRLLGSVIERLAKQPPELLVFLNRPQAARQILTMARAAGLTSEVLGADNVILALRAPAKTEIWRGARIAQFYLPELADAKVMEKLELLRQLRGFPATYETAFAYDAVYLLKQAVESGGDSRLAVRQYLERLARTGQVVEGFAGPYSFDHQRNARRPLHVLEVGVAGQSLVATLVP